MTCSSDYITILSYFTKGSTKNVFDINWNVKIVIHIIFLVVTEYTFSTLTVEGKTYNHASILCIELEENPKNGTHEVH